MKRSDPRRAVAVAVPIALFAIGPTAGPQRPAGADDTAVEIALSSLAAIERGWGLAAYDGARRVRAAVNLRDAVGDVGVTANAVLDRGAARWRLDASGDVGPLTLLVADGRATLHVPAVRQYARRPAGGLAPGGAIPRSLQGEVAAARARLRSGYGQLTYGGRETLDGATVHRIEDALGDGATATYWIDDDTRLPRRVALDRPGRRDVTIDLSYGGSGTRPVRVVAYLQGQRDVRVVASPRYDGAGRVARLVTAVRVAGGGELSLDVNLDWSPRISPSFFGFAPPPGAQEVPFDQLLGGVLFAAAGKLGGLAQALGGG